MPPQKLKEIKKASLETSLENNIFDESYKKIAIEEANAHVIHSIISDFYMSKMTALMNGLNPMHSVKERHVISAAKSFSSMPKAFGTSLLMKIACLQVNNLWNSQQSFMLRKNFKLQLPIYLAKLNSIVPLSIQDFIIKGKDIKSYERISDNFLGFEGFGIKKSRKTKNGSNVGIIVRELKKAGYIIFAIAKGYGNDFIADDVIEYFSKTFKEYGDFEKFLKDASEKFENVSIAVGRKRANKTDLYIAGNINVYNNDMLIHIGNEENKLGSNIQKIKRKKKSLTIKLHELKIDKYSLEGTIILSTALLARTKITMEQLKDLRRDDNALLILF